MTQPHNPDTRTIKLTFSAIGDEDTVVVCDLCSAVVLDHDQHAAFHANLLHSGGGADLFTPFLVSNPTVQDEPTEEPIMAGDQQTCTEHWPTQHRDMKEPWCDNCGLTASYRKPEIWGAEKLPKSGPVMRPASDIPTMPGDPSDMLGYYGAPRGL